MYIRKNKSKKKNRKGKKKLKKRKKSLPLCPHSLAEGYLYHITNQPQKEEHLMFPRY